MTRDSHKSHTFDTVIDLMESLESTFDRLNKRLIFLENSRVNSNSNSNDINVNQTNNNQNNQFTTNYNHPAFADSNAGNWQQFQPFATHPNTFSL